MCVCSHFGVTKYVCMTPQPIQYGTVGLSVLDCMKLKKNKPANPCDHACACSRQLERASGDIVDTDRIPQRKSTITAACSDWAAPNCACVSKHHLTLGRRRALGWHHNQLLRHIRSVLGELAAQAWWPLGPIALHPLTPTEKSARAADSGILGLLRMGHVNSRSKHHGKLGYFEVFRKQIPQAE